MSKQRRHFSPEFKAQVALELLTGQKRPAQLCREHQIKDSLLHRWRQQFIERSPRVFETPQQQSSEQARIAELERLVGRLTLELDAAHLPWRAVPGQKLSNWLGCRYSQLPFQS